MPTSHWGFNEEQMRFLESFLLFSLLTPSAPLSAEEKSNIQHNFNNVALRGRDPALKLRSNNGREILLRDWARGNFQTNDAGL